MNRLTLKINNEYITKDTKCMKNKYIHKLGQLEDIEEELEMPLIKYLEWKTQGKKPYYIHNGKIIIMAHYSIVVGTKEIHVWNGNTKERTTLYFKDYGTTWALTKEELL